MKQSSDNIVKIIVALLVGVFLGWTASNQPEVTVGSLLTRESVEENRFNEFLLDRYTVKDAFSQQISVKKLIQSETLPYITHRLYSADGDMAIQFKISFHGLAKRTATLDFDYLIKDHEDKWVSELSDSTEITINKSDFAMRIDLSNNHASYYIDEQLRFEIPMLHDVARMGTRYSGATYELKSQNPD